MKELEQFDAGFDPIKKEGMGGNRRPSSASLADGNHVFTIIDASLETVNGKPCVRFGLQAGAQVVEHLQFVNNQTGVNILGQVLVALGVPADQWLARGLKPSVEIPKAVRTLAGIRVKGAKKADGEYARIYFNQALGRAEPTYAPPETSAEGGEDEIPF